MWLDLGAVQLGEYIDAAEGLIWECNIRITRPGFNSHPCFLSRREARTPIEAVEVLGALT